MKTYQNAEFLPTFFYETPIREFFRGFHTNCTTRLWNVSFRAENINLAPALTIGINLFSTLLGGGGGARPLFAAAALTDLLQ